MAARRRVHWLDVLVIALALAAVGYVYYRVDTVLNYRWDWAFLPQYLLRWDEEQRRWIANILLQGVATTLRLALWSMLLAALIGVVMGVMRTSRRLLARLVSRSYVELVRNMPPLVFIFIFYFFLSSQLMPLLGVDALARDAGPTTRYWLEWLFGPAALFENILSGILCLALFEGAYVTEIVRAGIQAVPRGQSEAGVSVGLNRRQVLRYVVLPQALHKVLPPLAGQFITLIKDSSIVSLISVQELTFIGTEVSVSTSRVFETWIAVAGLYFLLCFSLALLFGRLEKRAALKQRTLQRKPS